VLNNVPGTGVDSDPPGRADRYDSGIPFHGSSGGFAQAGVAGTAATPTVCDAAGVPDGFVAGTAAACSASAWVPMHPAAVIAIMSIIAAIVLQIVFFMVRVSHIMAVLVSWHCSGNQVSSS
jgi:hypothetical protein